jgi:hypothetical protein
MHIPVPLLATLALLACAGCKNYDDQGGNGPGHADGAGGRTDAPTEPLPPAGSTKSPEEEAPGNAPGTTGNPPGETIRKPADAPLE